jgi:hypothetical protein
MLAVKFRTNYEPVRAFESWKRSLWEDCVRQDRELAFTTLGDECLRLLWEDGTEPLVQAIIEGGNETK